MLAIVASLLLSQFNVSQVVGSAPICTYNGSLYQCYYYTAQACYQAAGSHSVCVANPGR